MEFSIFRLEIRGILFGIAVLCYIVYCIKKRKFLHNYNRIFADIHLRKYLFIFFFLIYL